MKFFGFAKVKSFSFTVYKKTVKLRQGLSSERSASKKRIISLGIEILPIKNGDSDLPPSYSKKK